MGAYAEGVMSSNPAPVANKILQARKAMEKSHIKTHFP